MSLNFGDTSKVSTEILSEQENERNAIKVPQQGFYFAFILLKGLYFSLYINQKLAEIAKYGNLGNLSY